MRTVRSSRSKRVVLLVACMSAGLLIVSCQAPPELRERPDALPVFAKSSGKATRSRIAGGRGAPPNGAAYEDMYFRHAGVNPFVDTEDDPRATFGLDVDTASFSIARRYLQEAHVPPPEAIRVEELINAFDYHYPPPRHGDFNVSVDGVAVPTGVRRYVVRFGLRARDVTRAERKPARLTFVVDVSGSMNSGNRLGAVKRGLHMLLDQLRPEDQVGLVVYGTTARIVLEHTADKARILDAIDELEAEGATNVEQGLVLAYSLAREHALEGGINRLILCSDGVGNVGRTSADAILRRVGEQARAGIELSTVGFGMGNYNDVLMERLADAGDGNYAYVDDEVEARRVFVEQLTGMLQTIARDAKVQVEWNPELVQSYRLIGYENRELRDDEFRNDRVDAGEVGAGHQVTALFEIKLVRGFEGVLAKTRRLATLRLRYQRSDAPHEVIELARDLTYEAFEESLDGIRPGLRLALAAAWLGERLRQSPWVRPIDMATLRALAAPLPELFDLQPQVVSLCDMIEQLAALENQTRYEGVGLEARAWWSGR